MCVCGGGGQSKNTFGGRGMDIFWDITFINSARTEQFIAGLPFEATYAASKHALQVCKLRINLDLH